MRRHRVGNGVVNHERFYLARHPIPTLRLLKKETTERANATVRDAVFEHRIKECAERWKASRAQDGATETRSRSTTFVGAHCGSECRYAQAATTAEVA